MRPLLALAFTIAMAAAMPASAATEMCGAAPASLRSLAAMSDAGSARKAEGNISVGEALCAARNPAEADKKFRRAARDLGFDLDAVLAPKLTLATGDR